MFVDSHCHIAGPEFAADLDAVIARAREAGVTQALVILAADDEPELQQAAVVSARWREARYAIGIHPHAAGAFGDHPARAAGRLGGAVAAQPLARAIGEIGLDYHYDLAPRDAQRTVFRQQIRLARDLRLPIVIHSREAEDDTFNILAEESAGEVGGVFHCFTGGREMARRALDAGFHLSLSGIVTFPRALELKAVAKMVPADRLLIETDSPFLAPVPHRGTRNEPARVVGVAEAIAGLRGTTTEAVGLETLENFNRLFSP
ncbi:MAG: TatD family hydrolase [Vicinamibacterales bacterium]